VRAFSVHGPEAARRHLAESGEIMLALLLPAVVGLSLTGHDLAMVVLGADFRDTAEILIPILSFVWLFQALTQNYVHVSFHMTAQSRGMMLQALVSLAANFALIVPMTMIFGIIGAAVAVLSAEVIGMVAGLLFARSHFALPLEPRRIGRVVGATALMAMAVHLAGQMVPDAGFVSLGVKILAGVVSYAIGAVLFNVADAAQRLVDQRRRRLGPSRTA
jgi:O-antigen/teichoic acid export membrane protein